MLLHRRIHRLWYPTQVEIQDSMTSGPHIDSTLSMTLISTRWMTCAVCCEFFWSRLWSDNNGERPCARWALCHATRSVKDDDRDGFGARLDMAKVDLVWWEVMVSKRRDNHQAISQCLFQGIGQCVDLFVFLLRHWLVFCEVVILD